MVQCNANANTDRHTPKSIVGNGSVWAVQSRSIHASVKAFYLGLVYLIITLVT